MDDVPDIHDFNSKEKLEEALSDPDIRDELIEQIESQIREAAEAVEKENEDIDEILEDFFISEDFVEAFIEAASNLNEDISFIPNRIIENKLSEYAILSGARSSSLFSLEKNRKNLGIFHSIEGNNTEIIYPENYIDFISIIPDKYINRFAKEFWRNIPNIKTSRHSSSKYDFFEREVEFDNTFSVQIFYNLDLAIEIIADMKTKYFEGESSDPDFIDNFLGSLKPNNHKDMKLQEYIVNSGLTKEEQVDIIKIYFDSEKEINTTLAKISEFVATKNRIPEEILTIPREVIVGWGIKSGTYYENAPWKIYKLLPIDLFVEGVDMRLCLSDPELGYYNRVSNSIIEVWSIRSKNGKRRITIEILPHFRDIKDPIERGKCIQQIKGKANRLPGFAKDGDLEEKLPIKFKDEVYFIFHLMKDMNINLSGVDDIKNQLKMLGLSF